MNQLSMSKFMHYFFINFEFKLDNEHKKILCDIFKRKSSIKIKDMKNYVEVTSFEKSISYKRKDDVYYQEVLKLKTDCNYPNGWFNELSYECKKYLNFVFRKKYYDDTDRLVDRYNSFEHKTNSDDNSEYSVNSYSSFDNWFDVVDDKICKFKDYVVANFKEDLYFDIDGDLKEFKNDLTFGRECICDFDRNLKMICFCVSENRFDMLDVADNEIILNDEIYYKYVVLKENIPLTTKEKMYSSLNRTINKFNEYAFVNADKFKYFVTLTFANKNDIDKHSYLNVLNDKCNKELNIEYIDDVCDYDCCYNALDKFMKRIKINVKRYNDKNSTNYEVSYIGVPEYQKNGAIHYHFLFGDLPDNFFYDVASWLDYDYSNKKKNNGVGIKYWTSGKSDVQLIRDKARVTSYVGKYMIKSMYELDETDYFDRLNKKRYFVSHNLETAKVDYVDYFDVDKMNIYSSYTKEVINSFNDSKITKTIYQIAPLSEKDMNKKFDVVS